MTPIPEAWSDRCRSWSVATWAPFAFLGVEINRLSSPTHASAHTRRSSIELDVSEKGGSSSGSQDGKSSGQYLGIMNLYTTIPQFIGTMISWVVFSILEPGKSHELHSAPGEEKPPPLKEDGPNAIAVCLFIGACSACFAAVATRRLKRFQTPGM